MVSAYPKVRKLCRAAVNGVQNGYRVHEVIKLTETLKYDYNQCYRAALTGRAKSRPVELERNTVLELNMRLRIITRSSGVDSNRKYR